MESKFTFCMSCGSSSLTQPESKRLYCSHCGFTFFLNAAAAAAAILVADDQVLLTIRARDPGAGLLDLPGGFIDPGEDVESGLRRELIEELGIEVKHLQYFCSGANIYPFAGVDYQTCDIIFIGKFNRQHLQPRDDVAGVEWHSRERIPFSRIAFPSIRSALQKYSDEAK
jgi:NADH pyrophosphatase NudC (nudix superfamily)